MPIVPAPRSVLVIAVLAAGLVAVPDTAHTLTSAHGSASDRPAWLPATITMAGLDSTITRAPSAPAFRIPEVDGDANVPGTDGRLNLLAVIIRGGNAVAPYPGGGIANRSGALSLTTGTVTGNTTTSSGVHKNSGAVNLPTGHGSHNTPDNCAPSGSVPGCAG
ncbi:hypothetical protein [Streptomyces sp. IB2014 016-6]|uniref:hypothetical protein n=1 Tax=Streptomyces sp. IB2014 016-6 TaxID=2517818 RepID=UPI0011CA15EF|nr:hypothetical protein [Streptomyces sp. IB2014 016-6]TXL84541.1 hypothetical protein EW053_34155 [Streptomyces sp. IB2014 016-6]